MGETRESARVVRGSASINRDLEKEVRDLHERNGLAPRSVRSLVYRYRAGDTVRVKGVGDWVLATDERNGLVVRLEQPEIVAPVQEITLVRSSENSTRLSTLVQVANRAGAGRVRDWALEDLGLETVSATKRVTLALSRRVNAHGDQLEGLEASHAALHTKFVWLLVAACVLVSAEAAFWIREMPW